MAIGDTVQAGLMRVDPSAILEAGRVKGQLGQQIGQTLGGLATTYFDTKRRNKELEGERKGITDALKMVGKFRPDMSDDINAQIQFLENPENPLSARVAGGIRFLQNIDMAEKLRSASQLEAQRKKELSMAQRINELEADKRTLENIRTKFENEEAFERADLYPVSERVGREKELDVAKVRGAQANVKNTEAQTKSLEQKIKEVKANKYLNIEEKEEQIKLLREQRLGLQLEREKSERAVSGLTDASMMQPDEENEIFQEFETLNLRDAFQGDVPGVFYRSMSAIAEPFGGGATETIEQAQKLESLNALLRPAMVKQLSSRPSNYTLQTLEKLLPMRGDSNAVGVAKLQKLIPILNERLKESVSTVRMGNESANYYQDALTQAKLLPNIIGGLEVSLENYFTDGDKSQPTGQGRRTGRTTQNVGYRLINEE